MPRGKPGLLELLQPTALPAPQKEVDNGPVPDTTDAPNLPVFGLDSLDNRLIITPEKQVPDNGIITLQINQQFTSLTPTVLTIDQSDPTNVKFTSAGGGISVGNLFGPSHTIMTRGSTHNTGSVLGGAVERIHPFINYDSVAGTYTINRSGTYQITIHGRTIAPTTFGSIVTRITTDTSTLATGYPTKIQNVRYFDGANIPDAEIDILETATFFAAAGTVVTPNILPSWNAGFSWNDMTVIITSIYGPGSTAETEWTLGGAYGYRTTGTLGPGIAGPFGSYGFTGAPGGSSISYHPVNTVAPYEGDAATPLYYPDGPMYYSFVFQPYPDLLEGDLTVTAVAWDSGAPPHDLEIGMSRFNNGNGVAVQGFYVTLPGGATNTSYAGTSFKLLVTAEGICSNHEMYFRHCYEGQNGATDVPGAILPYFSASDGITPNGQLFANNNYYWYEDGPVQLVSSGSEQNLAAVQMTFFTGTIWGLPGDMTAQVTFEGYVRKLVGENYEIETTMDPPTYSPIVTYNEPTETSQNDWNITPVGHWTFKQAIGQDYWGQDINWPGAPFPEYIPALYKVDFIKDGDLMGSIYFSMGNAA